MIRGRRRRKMLKNAQAKGPLGFALLFTNVMDEAGSGERLVILDVDYWPTEGDGIVKTVSNLSGRWTEGRRVF